MWPARFSSDPRRSPMVRGLKFPSRRNVSSGPDHWWSASRSGWVGYRRETACLHQLWKLNLILGSIVGAVALIGVAAISGNGPVARHGPGSAGTCGIRIPAAQPGRIGQQRSDIGRQCCPPDPTGTRKGRLRDPRDPAPQLTPNSDGPDVRLPRRHTRATLRWPASQRQLDRGNDTQRHARLRAELGSRCWRRSNFRRLQGAIAVPGPYKKTQVCVRFSTLSDEHNAVASTWTAYGG